MKYFIFLILILPLICIDPVYGIYLNFELVDSMMYKAPLFKLYDMDYDGIDEIIFRSDWPVYLGARRFFIYSLTHDSLIYGSEPMGGVIKDLCPADINYDGEVDVLYSYDDDIEGTHNLKAAYGPDFIDQQSLFSRVNARSVSKIRQFGTFRGNQNPIYWAGSRKLFVIGDNLEIIDSIPNADEYEYLTEYLIDWLENGEYRLTKFRKRNWYRDEYPSSVSKSGYIDVYNESFELIHSQTVFSLGARHSCIASVDYFRTVYDRYDNPSSYILGWNWALPDDVDGWTHNIDMFPFGGGERNRVLNYVDYSWNYNVLLNAHCVDYSGDGIKSLLTLQQIVNPLGYILRDTETGEEIGYGNTEHIGGDGIFGNCDLEPGKELYVGHTGAIRVYKIWESITDVDNDIPEKPVEIDLFTNYPNPFNSSTNIGYVLANTSDVRIDVYNIQGQNIETILNVIQSPGEYSVNWEASSVASGVYFYRLTTGEISLTKKMTIIK